MADEIVSKSDNIRDNIGTPEELGIIEQRLEQDGDRQNCPVHTGMTCHHRAKDPGLKIPIRRDRARATFGVDDRFRVSATVVPGALPFGTAPMIEIPQNISDALVKSPSTGSRSPQRGSSPSSDTRGPITPVHQIPVTKSTPANVNSE